MADGKLSITNSFKGSLSGSGIIFWSFILFGFALLTIIVISVGGFWFSIFMGPPGVANIQTQLSFDLIFIFSSALHSGSKTKLDFALLISNFFFFNW